MPNTFVPQTAPLTGRHRAYEHLLEGMYHFEAYAGTAAEDARFAAYRALTAELQAMIQRAVATGQELRAQGSEWSLSQVGLAKDRLVGTKLLRLLRLPIQPGDLAASYGGDAAKLRFFECGESISVVNRVLRRDGLALKASGSNDGQTLAGAVSTGTHGSAFSFGATPDFVVGLHIVAGPNKHVFVQRSSAPVVKQEFADKIGATFIQSDELFNAALVSFGSFGIIQGMLIETRDLFMLHATRFFHPFNDGLKRAAKELDFSGLDLSLSQLPATAPRDRPYHFQMFFNPNEAERPTRASVLMMFEDDWAKYRDTYATPNWDNGAAGPGASGLDLIGKLFNILPAQLTRGLVNSNLETQFREFYQMALLGDLFRGEPNTGKLQVTGTAVPRERVLDTLEVVFQTYQNFVAQHGTILPLIVSCRFVKGTQALLGFTKFPETCTLELDTIYSPKSGQYLENVRQALDQAGIPFTVHWGKLDACLTPDRLRTIYGEDLQRWLKSRRSILENDAVCRVFTNDYLRRFELDRLID